MKIIGYGFKRTVGGCPFFHPIRTKVTAKTYKRLEQIMQNSYCRSMGEVTRKILSRETILILKRDISMNGPMEELTLIRKELKSIGININQQTRHFQTAENESQRGDLARSDQFISKFDVSLFRS